MFPKLWSFTLKQQQQQADVFLVGINLYLAVTPRLVGVVLQGRYPLQSSCFPPWTAVVYPPHILFCADFSWSEVLPQATGSYRKISDVIVIVFQQGKISFKLLAKTICWMAGTVEQVS